MSGHSHWATTQRAKGVKDAARGKLFSKLGKQISIAVKEGGGASIDSNFRLRIAVETARAANMPKDNIERAISKGSGEGAALNEILYEGFGPGGVGVLIQATTDNKNRAAQELKNVLEKSGGSMGGPNSVSFNFVGRGYLFVKKQEPVDEQLLSLIDCGVEDFQEAPDGIEVYVEPSHLISTKEALVAKNFEVLETKLIKKPVNTVELSDKDAEKLQTLIEQLDELDDVDEVFVNAA
jgi:YebC/PmpR family DNA-binding regulatory protein